ncbi:MAG: response regulator transcription factor [Erysipelotrichaceae bacterium]
MKIFIVEDDVALRNQLCEFLNGYGYETLVSDDYKNMTSVLLSADCDLILLDINLPYQDGYYICREIRKQSSIPMIVVTSRASDMDELMSMNLGADDFVTKPYNSQILLARIDNLLRRTKVVADKIEYNGLTFYSSRNKICYKDNETELTKNESFILNLLLSKKGSIVSRDDLMNALWQTDEFVDDNTLTVNINRLRKKLEEIGLNDFIVTKRGQGYMV